MTRATVAIALLAAFAVAQNPVEIPLEVRSHDLDSGFLDHSGATRAVVFSGIVRFDQANSLRLRFGAVNLPETSELRLRSASDGAEQHFDARSLADWDGHSAVFNGGEVSVELRAGPGTRANRVVVDAVEVGLPVAPAEPIDSLCGADDRALSADPRQGRQYPTGCTAWLVNEFTVLTAGHCTSNPAQQIHFGVPLSSSSGALRYPPPDDQYPYEVGALQRLSSGVGADWAVTRAVRNANTGLYPGQAQGQWYEIGAVPRSTSGQVIRITGYGTTSAPVDRRWNQAQKTHADALTQVASTYLRYVPDTTGGNSGSPVIHDNTGKAIGIHTHAGCTSGGNHGTRIDRSDLAAALQAIMASKILGRVEALGQGCAGLAGTPTLTHRGPAPTLGQTTTLVLDRLAPGSPAVLAYGLSDRSWNGTPLPYAIPFSPGCSVWISLDITLGGVSGPGGTSSFPLSVPGSQALVGLELFGQGFGFEAIPAGGVRVVAANALKLTVGRDL